METKRNQRKRGEAELNSLAGNTNSIYLAYTVNDLRTELKRRDLSVRGLKTELVSSVWLYCTAYCVTQSLSYTKLSVYMVCDCIILVNIQTINYSSR